jgi:glucose 1-dehydrogenase/3-oxoacyl-[acyl-carrier protein] reductase
MAADRFVGKTAIVTGGASGIGRAVAVRLAAEGGNAVVVDRDRQLGEATVGDLGGSGRHGFICADVSSRTAVDSASDEVVSLYGGIDILINNAGILRVAPALETSDELFDEVVANNLRSVFLFSTAVARQMVRSGTGGRIVNISSIHAVVSEPNASAYTAAKGGIEAYSRTLASELAVHGITVNCVRPGATWTELTRPIYTPEVLQALKMRVPLAAPCQPEAIAAGVAYLASDEAAYVTGTTLDIDGGYIMDGSLPAARYT